MPVRDVVCSMDVDGKGKFKKDYNGKTYYFCSPSCLQAFGNNPQKFAG